MAKAKQELTDTRVQGRHIRPARNLTSVDLSDDVITVDEVALRLDIPKATLYGWRYRGIGPRGHKVGKHLRYRWSDVLAWLDDQD